MLLLSQALRRHRRHQTACVQHGEPVGHGKRLNSCEVPNARCPPVFSVWLLLSASAHSKTEARWFQSRFEPLRQRWLLAKHDLDIMKDLPWAEYSAVGTYGLMCRACRSSAAISSAKPDTRLSLSTLIAPSWLKLPRCSEGKGSSDG